MGKEDRRKARKAFWFSLGMGLFVFLTGAGLLAVDYQGRRLSFGDSTPLVLLDRQGETPRLRVKAFGIEDSWDAAGLDQALQFLYDFGCLPRPSP